MLKLTSRKLANRLVLGVWLAGLLLSVSLIAKRPSSQIRGIAVAEPTVLTAPSSGTLLELGPEIHQIVHPGDTLLRFDKEMLEARRRVLVAEIQAASEAQVLDRQGRTRMFERDREQASIQFRELSARVQEQQARLSALEAQLALSQELYEQGVGSKEKVLEAEREIKVIETRLTADRVQLSLVKRTATRATDRAAKSGTSDWQIEAARRELEDVEEQIERRTVVSLISGQVTEIYRHEGEWLPAGEPVLRIAPLAAEEVHAWMNYDCGTERRNGSTRRYPTRAWAEDEGPDHQHRSRTSSNATGTLDSKRRRGMGLPPQSSSRGEHASSWRTGSAVLEIGALARASPASCKLDSSVELTPGLLAVLHKPTQCRQ